TRAKYRAGGFFVENDCPLPLASRGSAAGTSPWPAARGTKLRLEGVLKHCPAQGGALDPHRVLTDTLKGLHVPEGGTGPIRVDAGVGPALERHHPAEPGDEVADLVPGLPLDGLAHHGRRRLADRAALSFDGDLRHFPILEAEVDVDLVTAQRVHPLCGRLRVVETTPVPGVPVMVEDDLAVELFECHQPTPNGSPALRNPVTVASMSSSVL